MQILERDRVSQLVRNNELEAKVLEFDEAYATICEVRQHWNKDGMHH